MIDLTNTCMFWDWKHLLCIISQSSQPSYQIQIHVSNLEIGRWNLISAGNLQKHDEKLTDGLSSELQFLHHTHNCPVSRKPQGFTC